MNELRTIDAAWVRTAAAQVQADLEDISNRAKNLQHILNVMHEELEYADPVKDKLFEKYMYHLVRYITPLNAYGDLMELVKAMQKFGLPADSIIPSAKRLGIHSSQKVGTDSLSVRLPNVSKHIIEEPINA